MKTFRAQDLSDAEPTITHMCITQLYRNGHVCTCIKKSVLIEYFVVLLVPINRVFLLSFPNK